MFEIRSGERGNRNRIRQSNFWDLNQVRIKNRCQPVSGMGVCGYQRALSWCMNLIHTAEVAGFGWLLMQSKTFQPSMAKKEQRSKSQMSRKAIATNWTVDAVRTETANIARTSTSGLERRKETNKASKESKNKNPLRGSCC